MFYPYYLLNTDQFTHNQERLFRKRNITFCFDRTQIHETVILNVLHAVAVKYLSPEINAGKCHWPFNY